MKPSMGNGEKRRILSEIALGNIAPDTVIVNGTVFNAFTREFIEKQSIWIKNGMIAYVGPEHDSQRSDKTQVIDADGMTLLPGLIEGHTHLSRSGIEEYIKHVIPSGVTTVIMETIDFGLIAGKKAIEYFVQGLVGQPIQFYYTVPPLCGLTPQEEINAPTNEELLPLLKDPKCLGVREIYWGNFFLKGEQGERVKELVSSLVTQERVINLENSKESKDVLMLVAVDRIGKGGAFMGLLKGFGLRRGAYGSTMCWDTVDMIVVGCDTKSMGTVIKRLKEIGGGGVYTIGERVVAEFPAPLGGLLSLKPMEKIRDETKRLKESLRQNGVKWENPVLTVDTLSTAAIPHLRITHHGYVRLKDRKELPVEVT